MISPMIWVSAATQASQSEPKEASNNTQLSKSESMLNTQHHSFAHPAYWNSSQLDRRLFGHTTLLEDLPKKIALGKEFFKPTAPEVAADLGEHYPQAFYNAQLLKQKAPLSSLFADAGLSQLQNSIIRPQGAASQEHQFQQRPLAFETTEVQELPAHFVRQYNMNAGMQHRPVIRHRPHRHQPVVSLTRNNAMLVTAPSSDDSSEYVASLVMSNGDQGAVEPQATLPVRYNPRPASHHQQYADHRHASGADKSRWVGRPISQTAHRALANSASINQMRSQHNNRLTNKQYAADVPKIARQPALQSAESEKPKAKSSMLTNEQLISLIDELKEFNSRQVDKVKNAKPEGKKTDESDSKQPEEDASDDDEDDDNNNKEDAKRAKLRETAKPFLSLMKGVVDQGEQRQGSINREQNDSEKQLPPPPPLLLSRQQQQDSSESEAKEAEPESKRSKQEDDEDRMNNDDLLNFAKFLMTKEGANMKFQLGLEKDHSPEDGDDEEERKAQESLNRQKIRSSTAKELEDLDKKHEQASKHMDRLMDDVLFRVKELSKRQKKKAKKEVENEVVDDQERARRRRESLMSGANKTVSKKTSSSTKDGSADRDDVKKPEKREPRDENFAKKLIQQELLEDQRESSHEPAVSTQSIAPQKSASLAKATEKLDNINEPRQTTHVRKAGKKSRVSKDGSVSTNLVVDHAERSRNSANQVYAKQARRRDKAAASSELNKTRDAKARLRARMPTDTDPLIKRALDGGYAIQAERGPDGKITLKTDRNNHMLTLEVPERGSKGRKRKKNKRASGDALQQDAGTNNSAPVPSLALDTRRDQVLDKVKLSSAQKLQDEYPVSNRVGDRLNKLSNSLDKYFNDGFLQQIDKKTRMGAVDVSQLKEQPQQIKTVQSVNRQQSEPPPVPKGDPDFDVNVNVDGKRENDEEELRGDDEDGYDEEAKSSPARTKSASERRRQPRMKRKHSTKRTSKSLASLAPYARASSGANKKQNDDGIVMTGRRDESTKKVDLQFENNVKVAPSADPVDNETLDTPIGPDNETGMAMPDLSSAKSKTNSTEVHETTSYGTKSAGNKFYEEPEWR